jgi:hypothetical protein
MSMSLGYEPASATLHICVKQHEPFPLISGLGPLGLGAAPNRERYHTVEFECFVASSFEGCVAIWLLMKGPYSTVWKPGHLERREGSEGRGRACSKSGFDGAYMDPPHPPPPHYPPPPLLWEGVGGGMGEGSWTRNPEP